MSDREELRIEWLAPPWGAKVKAPKIVYPPTPRNPAVVERHQHAIALAACSAAKLGTAQLAQLDALAAAHAANLEQRRSSAADRAALHAPLPRNADLAMIADRARQCADLDRFLGVLDARVVESGQAFGDAVLAARADLWVASEAPGGVVRAIRVEKRETEAQIAELEQHRDDLELLRLEVESKLRAWNPVEPTKKRH